MTQDVFQAVQQLQQLSRRYFYSSPYWTERIDRALTNILCNPNKSGNPHHLVRNALSDARKKLHRRNEICSFAWIRPCDDALSSDVETIADSHHEDSGTVFQYEDWLERACLIFINDGFYIELNDNHITLYDPLFLLKNTKVIENFEEDLRANTIDELDVDIDGHDVHIKVTLCPKEFRLVKGQGGKATDEDPKLRGLYIPENQGRISIIRNNREIYYEIIPKLLTHGVEDIDRFIGIEVSFPATLDEYLQVRNVKRGAEPIGKLREELRNFLIRPIRKARADIRKIWEDNEAKKVNESRQHQLVEEAVERAEKTLPIGKAGWQLDIPAQVKIIEDLISDLEIDPIQHPERVMEFKQRIQELPITIVNAAWPGKELFEITHLNGKATIRINDRHPFIQQVYKPLKDLVIRNPSTVTAEEAISIAKKAEIGLDILFMAYAKAENMAENPDVDYSDLRSYWGQHAQAYIREALGGR